jgi:aspartyl-tRNA(Asn)/glutamyl-tRNA(Gln) amidotransferase subunit A
MTGNAASRGAAVTERLEAAGGVLLGKLSTREFAMAARPSIYSGRRRATHGTEIISVGLLQAAVAPALQLDFSRRRSAPIPEARSETRLRFAASPEWKRPMAGSVAAASCRSPSLDHIGPMTRTVHDNALMLQVIPGHDPADLYYEEQQAEARLIAHLVCDCDHAAVPQWLSAPTGSVGAASRA